MTSAKVGIRLKKDFHLRKYLLSNVVDKYAERCGALRCRNSQNFHVFYEWDEESYQKLLTLKIEILEDL